MQSKSSREEIISDFGSSEGQAMASILSSKKRRCSKRSRLSSESVCRGPMVEEAEEAEKDVGPGHEICSSAPYDMQTPRTSERLQRKRTSRSFSLPSREKVLHSMLSGIKLKNIYSQKRIRQLRPRKLVNNFLREHTSYVCREDEYYDSDDAGMSDWIDDDDDADDDDGDDESAESTLESDCREVRCKLQKKSVEASTSESIENCESDDHIPLSNVREKLRSHQNLNSDSDDSLTKRTKGPIYSSTPYDMQTPRTSERLQRKQKRSFSFPSREKVLDSMFSSVKLKNMYSQKRIRQLRPRKLV